MEDHIVYIQYIERYCSLKPPFVHRNLNLSITIVFEGETYSAGCIVYRNDPAPPPASLLPQAIHSLTLYFIFRDSLGNKAIDK